MQTVDLYRSAHICNEWQYASECLTSVKILDYCEAWVWIPRYSDKLSLGSYTELLIVQYFLLYKKVLSFTWLIMLRLPP